MQYAVDANGELRTPGGCRIDNGRCFAAIHYDVVCKVICFEFAPGEFFYAPGPTEPGVYYDLCFTLDPGCGFNARTKAGRNSPLIAGRPPFFDLSAYPADYVPIGFPRDSIDDYFLPCNWP